MTDLRAHLLRAAVGFAVVAPTEPELVALHRCFDSWRGVGDIVAGMARQEDDLELRRYDGQGWRAMFFPGGLPALVTSHARTAWKLSPWAAVQGAAADALRRLEAGDAPRAIRPRLPTRRGHIGPLNALHFRPMAA